METEEEFDGDEFDAELTETVEGDETGILTDMFSKAGGEEEGLSEIREEIEDEEEAEIEEEEED
ncbi:MAG: hypothetical protein ACYTFG_22745 [Planctomycetota bacterium]|jgi:hypothetical protein